MEKSKLWYLENFNLFKGLSKADMMDLAAKTTMKTADKKQFIYFPDEPSKTVFLLKEGRVKIGTYTDDGKEIIKAVLQKGEIFGELSLVGEEKRKDFAQAMDNNTMICAVSISTLNEMMQSNSSMGLKITKIVGWRLKKIENRLESMIFKDARARIVGFLKDQALEHGRPVGTEMLIQNTLTHKDIANLTATSRQTVTTILNELREANHIYFDRRRILIRDMGKIQ